MRSPACTPACFVWIACTTPTVTCRFLLQRYTGCVLRIRRIPALPSPAWTFLQDTHHLLVTTVLPAVLPFCLILPHLPAVLPPAPAPAVLPAVLAVPAPLPTVSPVYRSTCLPFLFCSRFVRSYLTTVPARHTAAFYVFSCHALGSPPFTIFWFSHLPASAVLPPSCTAFHRSAVLWVTTTCTSPRTATYSACRSVLPHLLPAFLLPPWVHVAFLRLRSTAFCTYTAGFTLVSGLRCALHYRTVPAFLPYHIPPAWVRSACVSTFVSFTPFYRSFAPAFWFYRSTTYHLVLTAIFVPAVRFCTA